MDRSNDTRWLPAFFPTFFTLYSLAFRADRPGRSSSRDVQRDYWIPIFFTNPKYGIVILSGKRIFREIRDREGKVDSPIVRLDETRLDSRRYRSSKGRAREAGLLKRPGSMEKKRNSRINEIAIIDTPILALKDPLAPCTSVRDIIDPTHAIARIPLRFN